MRFMLLLIYSCYVELIEINCWIRDGLVVNVVFDL